MIKAMIFDLDGTIGNTISLCIKAFRKSIEPFIGRSVSDKEITATFGPSEEGTIMALIPEHYEEGVKRYLYHYKVLHNECPKPFEGISEIIRDLKKKGIRIAMVTGKGRKSTDITLEQFEIAGLFEWVETGSIKGGRKAEGITYVIEHFNIKPEEAYYIGDAPSDIMAARQAGVGMISAAWSDMVEVDELEKLKPDKLFRTIEEFKVFCKLI
jgi:phosphoglycolate phosphatase/pyrophosphatase PpaX